MADRSTARAFGIAFETLAKYAEVAECAGDQDILGVLRAVAEEIYDEQDGAYDYTADQMGADASLVTLGLASYKPWREVDTQADPSIYADDDELICYRGED